jgi:hypothetical protein
MMTTRLGWEGQGSEWAVWCHELNWAEVVSAQAYGKPLTDIFATKLPTVVQTTPRPAAVVDVSSMPRNEEFRFWVECTLVDKSVVRIPSTHDLLTRR